MGDAAHDSWQVREHDGLVDRAERKNLFLSAAVEAQELRAPVRIRNLSAQGAMIDGPILPNVGSSFVLRRLDLSIGATAAWIRDGRCGVKLDSTICIEEWVSGVPTENRTGSLGQTRVDAIQAALRNGEDLPVGRGFDVSAEPANDALYGRIAQELIQVKDLFDQVADRLTEDMDVLMRHAEALQNFDVAAQIIDHLSAVLEGEDPGAAVAEIPMHDLRNRLLGTPAIK